MDDPDDISVFPGPAPLSFKSPVLSRLQVLLCWNLMSYKSLQNNTWWRNHDQLLNTGLRAFFPRNSPLFPFRSLLCQTPHLHFVSAVLHCQTPTTWSSWGWGENCHSQNSHMTTIHSKGKGQRIIKTVTRLPKWLEGTYISKMSANKNSER